MVVILDFPVLWKLLKHKNTKYILNVGIGVPDMNNQQRQKNNLIQTRQSALPWQPDYNNGDDRDNGPVGAGDLDALNGK